MTVDPFVFTIVCVSSVLMIFFSYKMKYHADQCMYHLAAMLEETAKELCLRTQGDEQQRFREIRKCAQGILEKHQ